MKLMEGSMAPYRDAARSRPTIVTHMGTNEPIRPKPTQTDWRLARKAIGRALFGGDHATADPEDDDETYSQTQGRLVIEVARIINEVRKAKR